MSFTLKELVLISFVANFRWTKKWGELIILYTLIRSNLFLKFHQKKLFLKFFCLENKYLKMF